MKIRSDSQAYIRHKFYILSNRALTSSDKDLYTIKAIIIY